MFEEMIGQNASKFAIFTKYQKNPINVHVIHFSIHDSTSLHLSKYFFTFQCPYHWGIN